MLRGLLSLIAVILFLLAFQTSGFAGSLKYQGKVIAVSDGDTITVLTDQKTQRKIRLAAVDCPESGQDFGKRAKQRTSELVYGQTVTIEPVDTDRYGREVASVATDSYPNVGLTLVEEGLCWWFEKYAPHDSQMRAAQDAARDKKIGLWTRSDALPPWEYRKNGNQMTAPTIDIVSGSVIYNTNSKKYHGASCKGARACTRNCILLPKDEAISRGGVPCGICKGH